MHLSFILQIPTHSSVRQKLSLDCPLFNHPLVYTSVIAVGIFSTLVNISPTMLFNIISDSLKLCHVKAIVALISTPNLRQPTREALILRIRYLRLVYDVQNKCSFECLFLFTLSIITMIRKSVII